MTAPDERQWLHHPDTGGYFNCPASAVEAWIAMGWEKTDPPEEPNPVLAEHLAWREEEAARVKEQARQEKKAAAESDGDDSKTKAAKAAKSTATTEEK